MLEVSDSYCLFPDLSMATEAPDMQVANTAGPVEGAEAGEQAQAMPSVFETLKSVATRALIFYFIMSFFKKPAAPPAAGPDGTQAPARGAAANLYSEGMGYDMYVYLSEQEDFNDFNMPDSLVWKRLGLKFGDWTDGENSDSIFEFSS